LFDLHTHTHTYTHKTYKETCLQVSAIYIGIW